MGGARAGALAAAATAFLMVTTSALPALAADTDFTVSQPLALTGLAADGNRQVYWAVSQPSSPVIVALDQDGGVRGRMMLDVTVTDVQALASRNGVLYVGDIGDPQLSRESIRVLRIGEPRTGEGTMLPRVWEFTYPDGPHDAATLMITDRGTLFFVTRGKNPGIYRMPGQPQVGVTNQLERVADAPAGVSDGAFLPSENSFALWAETGLHLVDPYDFTIDAIGPVPRTGEAVSPGLEGAIMLGVGGKTPKVSVTQPPEGKQMVSPKPTPTPKPSAKPSAKATPTAAPAQPSTDENTRSGTFWALGLAAATAIAAGALTALWPSRRGAHTHVPLEDEQDAEHGDVEAEEVDHSEHGNGPRGPGGIFRD